MFGIIPYIGNHWVHSHIHGVGYVPNLGSSSNQKWCHSLVGDEVSILKPIKGCEDGCDVLVELGLIVARRRVRGLVGLNVATNKEHDIS